MATHKNSLPGLPRPTLVDVDPEDLTRVLDDVVAPLYGVDVDVEPHDDTGAELARLTAAASEGARDRDRLREAELGENWVETLSRTAAELGEEAEREVDVVDDTDRERGRR